MESDKSVTLSKDEKGDIFEIVNSLYLNFKGGKKKSFKQNFKSIWKEDNNLFKLVMTLYNAEDIIEGRKAKLEDEIEGGFVPVDWETKIVSWKKYRGMCIHQQGMVEILEKQLEDVEEGKGYISEESHDEAMKQLKEEQQEIIREQGDTIAKLRNKEAYHIEKKELAEKKLQVYKLYYEGEIKKLNSKE